MRFSFGSPARRPNLSGLGVGGFCLAVRTFGKAHHQTVEQP